MAGARRAGGCRPPRRRRRGSRGAVRLRRAHRRGGGRRHRLRAAANRQVAALRLRRRSGARAGAGRPPRPPGLVRWRGARRAGRDKVAAATGASRARVASADQVEADTGYPPGGVSPFALARVARVLIDNNLLVEGVVWVGAGSTTHMAGLPANELVRVARAEPADVVTDT